MQPRRLTAMMAARGGKRNGRHPAKINKGLHVFVERLIIYLYNIL
jgi:hypothetical protein